MASEYRFHQVTQLLNIVTLLDFPTAQLNDWKQDLEIPTRKRRSTGEIFTDLMDFDGSGDELFEENLVVFNFSKFRLISLQKDTESSLLTIVTNILSNTQHYGDDLVNSIDIVAKSMLSEHMLEKINERNNASLTRILGKWFVVDSN